MTRLLSEPAAALAYLFVAFTLVFIWPTLRLKLQTGTNAIVLPAGDTADAIVGRWFKATMAGLLAMTALIAFAPAPWNNPGALPLPWPEVRLIAGWLILAAALAVVALAQTQMGSSWRIGIDPKATALRAHGLFGRSRNPIFLGMRAMLVGLFLIMPNALSLAFLLLGEVLIQIQVRFEEVHLEHLHGDEYRNYRAKVPRWI
jgi:protein-S-isoprenylcysteine O-methyltransferase Ste14